MGLCPDELAEIRFDEDTLTEAHDVLFVDGALRLPANDLFSLYMNLWRPLLFAHRRFGEIHSACMKLAENRCHFLLSLDLMECALQSEDLDAASRHARELATLAPQPMTPQHRLALQRLERLKDSQSGDGPIAP